MADTIRESLATRRRRGRMTPYYSEVSGGLQREYAPAGRCDPAVDPQKAIGLHRAPSSKGSSCCEHHDDADPADGPDRAHRSGAAAAGDQRPGPAERRLGLDAGRARRSSSCCWSPPTRSCRRCYSRCSTTGSPTRTTGRSSGWSNYGVILTDPLWWQALGVTRVHHGRHRRRRAGAGLRAGAGDAQGAHARSRPCCARRSSSRTASSPSSRRSPGATPSDIDSGFVNHWFSWVPGIGADLNWFGGTVDLAVRHLPRRDLEDHAVHLAAAARRAGPGARRAAGGGEGRRRHLVAAAVEGDPAEHEGRDHGGPAVPQPRRVPHLRQHLHHDRRAPTTPSRSRSWPTGRPSRAAGDRPRLGGLGAAVPRAWC